MRPVFVLLLFCLGFVGTAARAQDGPRFLIPEKIERATVADEKGVLQWAPYEAPECHDCKGKKTTKCVTCARFADDATNCPDCKRNAEKEAGCRACGALGKLPDPLEKVQCPACYGAGFLLCMVCAGGGRLKIGQAKQWSDCPGCRGDGGFKCGTCNGARLVEVAAVKPSLKDANAATLSKALAATESTLKQLEAFEPTGGDKARKAVKAMVKILEGGQAVHPAVKRTIKVFEDFMQKTEGGAQFQGHEEHQANAMNIVKGSSVYYLKHQKRMLELAHKRAEANEKLAAEQKGK